MNFIEEFKKLFKKNLAKKPMSIKDDRVAKVQEILGQVAGVDEKALPSKEALEKYLADMTRTSQELKDLRSRGVAFDDPELNELSRQSREAHAVHLKERSVNIEYRKDIKQLGRFVLDPLTPEEKQAKQAKQAIAKQETQSEKTRKARLARFDKQPKKGVKM